MAYLYLKHKLKINNYFIKLKIKYEWNNYLFMKIKIILKNLDHQTLYIYI